MNDSALHVVCSHCHAVNRVQHARLGEHPRCGSCHQPLFSGKPIELDQASFARHVERSDLPVLVDFWAEWCGPCKMMAPIFASAAQQLEPRLRFAKVDTEREPQIATRFGIRSIPTLILFKNGQECARQAGAMPLAALQQWLKQAGI